jgi:hypothetical protein
VCFHAEGELACSKSPNLRLGVLAAEVDRENGLRVSDCDENPPVYLLFEPTCPWQDRSMGRASDDGDPFLVQGLSCMCAADNMRSNSEIQFWP